MKKRLLSLLLALTMCLPLSVPVWATEQSNYRELFLQVESSDGAESERIAGELADAFDIDPDGILSAMASCSESQLDKAVQFLVYGKSYDNFLTFEETILLRKTLSHDNNAEICVLDKILSEISRFNDEMDPGGALDSTSIEAPLFQPDIIRSFIERHDYTAGADEGFFELMADVYRSEPKLLAEIVSDMDSRKVDYIARGIAYDVNKRGNYATKGAKTPMDSFSALVESAIADSDNRNLSTFWISDAPAAIVQPDPYAVKSAVTISNIKYTTAPLRLGEPETLSVTYQNADIGSSRTYVTKIYLLYNQVPVQVSTKTVIIPPGVNTIPQTYSINFSQWGSVYTIVKVYAQDGETLLASQQSGSSNTVVGKWRIDILLPENRVFKGTLALYDARGYRKANVECLGKSDSGEAMNLPNGNTPTGTYTGVLDGCRTTISSYGPYQVVNMIGVSGVIVSSQRSGIMIHGGTPSTNTNSPSHPLRPTYGCVRISNENQYLLETQITNLTSNTGYHEERGNITISEE